MSLERIRSKDPVTISADATVLQATSRKPTCLNLRRMNTVNL